MNYPSLDTPTLIADDFFGAGCVLGSVHSVFDPAELGSVTAEMSINGVVVGSGSGTDILEDPLTALSWVAGNLASRGLGLHRNEFVLLGSLVQTNWIRARDQVVIRNQPFGEVRATFTEEK